MGATDTGNMLMSPGRAQRIGRFADSEGVAGDIVVEFEIENGPMILLFRTVGAMHREARSPASTAFALASALGAKCA